MTARLTSLVADLEAAELSGDVDVTQVTMDSATVTPGALYCCVVGRHVDAHDLADEVVAAGAGSLLVERWLALDVPQVRVPSVRRALGPVAAAFHGHPSRRLSVVGVTGTNGKTTTTQLLGATLRGAGRRAGVLGTLSGARTTPEAPELQARLAEFAADGCEAVAMEVTSIAMDQHRVDGVEFAIGVWTNLTQDHLDYHGDMGSYFAAKAALFSGYRCRKAVVNGDDEWSGRLLDRLDIPAVIYRSTDAEGLELGPFGSRFSWRGWPVELALGGAHNVANALAAATAAEALGVSARQVAAGLTAAPVVPGRWERIVDDHPFAVIVDYAHTPDGLSHVLQAARQSVAGAGRVLVVFGCGGDRDRAKRPLMGEVASRLADVVVLTTDNPRSEDPLAIIGEAAAGAGRREALIIEPERERAIRRAVGEAHPGDIVVIAGKGHETGQVIGSEVLPFDDREVARRALAEVG